MELTVPTTCDTEYKKSKHRLDTYFNPKRNPVIEIFNFMQAKQDQHETTYQYVSRLRILSEFCDFGTDVNKWIIAKVVHSFNSDKLRREYLAKTNIEYKDLIEMGRNHDNFETQALQIEGKVEIKEEFVHSVQNSHKNRNFNKNNGSKPSHSKEARKCFSCGGSYPHEGDCPARGKKCNICHELNHFASTCKERGKSQFNKSAQGFKPKDKVNQI